MSSFKALVLGMLVALAPAVAEIADPLKPVRDLLDKRFSTELLEDRPALTLGYLMFAVRELDDSLSDLKVDRRTNVVIATHVNGGISRWTCEDRNATQHLSSRLEAKSAVTQCTLTTSGDVSETVPVVIERESGRIRVRLAFDSSESGVGPQVMFGTDFPKAVPKWVPVVPPDYVQKVRQVSFLDTRVQDVVFGRYVFDSGHPPDALGGRLEAELRSRGFSPFADLEARGASFMSLSDGVIRWAEFEVTKVEDGKSRCDLAFIQMGGSLFGDFQSGRKE